MVALVVSFVALACAGVALVLAWSVLRFVREQRAWKRRQARIFRDHAEFLKSLQKDDDTLALSQTMAASVTVNDKGGK